MNHTKSFKVKNPYRIDQEIRQEVSISDDLICNYDNSPWIAVDTEYLSFNPLLDKLCVIQIASKENSESENLRVEMVYVYEKEASEKLKNLFANEKIEKLFHVYSSDMPRIEKYIGGEVKGRIFDTKVAAKIAWTNTKDYGMKSLIRMFADPKFEQNDSEKGLNDWEIGPENWSNEQVFYMMQDVIYLDVLRIRISQMAARRGKAVLLNEVMEILPTISKLYRLGYTESVLAY